MRPDGPFKDKKSFTFSIVGPAASLLHAETVTGTLKIPHNAT